LKVVQDSAGSRLTLTGEGTTLPREALFVVLIAPLPLLAIPSFVLWHILHTSEDPEGVLVALLWLAVTIGILVKIGAAIRSFPALFDIDRGAGVARLGHRQFFGGELEEKVFGLDRIRRVTVLRLAPARSGASQLSVTFDLAPGSTALPEVAAMDMSVDALDEAKDVATFALRLGAAVGLPHSRVVRNDPRTVQVELASEPFPPASAAESPAREAPPAPAGPPAPAALEEQAATAVAREKIAAFDPASFGSLHDVKVWKPGTEVVFHRSFGFWGWLSVAAAACIVAGPLAYFWVESGSELAQQMTDSVAGQYMMIVVAGTIGLVLGGAGLAGIASNLPGTIRLDWTGRLVSIREGRWKAVIIPMDSISAVELDCIHEEQGGRSASDNVVIHNYCCNVRLRWRNSADADEVTRLVETYDASEPDPPYRAALPLVTELARALGVERRVNDYRA
jgi:hypothetical protein